MSSEEEEILQGIHEPIISEELFYDVQNVLDGKKKSKYKYSLINGVPLPGAKTLVMSVYRSVLFHIMA